MNKVVSFIASIALTLLVITIMYWLNKHVLMIKISEFMIGWIGCVIFQASKDTFDSND